MSWLNPIEENIINKYEVAAECGDNELALDIAVKDGKQMVRVIRELAKVASAANFLVGMIRVLDISLEGAWSEFSAASEALDNLSPEAKEVIDECTAQSAT